jgi:DNA topoisomerase-1
MTIVIIAEKPDAAKHLADSLADGKLNKKTSKYGVDYYEFNRNGKKHVVVAAVGHLFNLKQKSKGWNYPIFDVDWVPSYKARKMSMFSEKYFKTLEDLKKDGDSFIIACDYDNEGSLIGYNILRFIFGKENAKRMKFSTLAKPDLIKSYETMSSKLDTENIEAGLARHFLDFYYGVNTSRALTLAIKKSANRFAVLSAGRVQGPTLTLLADKEKEIGKFKAEPYFQVELKVLIGGKEVIALYEKEKIEDKKDAEKVYKECKGKDGIVKEVTKKEYTQMPPAPFNITSLQTEAYRLFGYSPKQTLMIAQDLYTRAFISYPRTSSEKLPAVIGNKDIMHALSKIDKYKKICEKILQGSVTPNEGKAVDSAHEAIHPTVQPPKRVLGGSAQRLYDLICRRYFSVFGTPGKRESVKITIDVNGHKFSVTGRRTIEKGWMEYYGPYAKFDEVIFPEIREGDKLKSKKLDLLSKETSPPPRFSQASIIKEMDKRGLGTRATRASILQTLYDRNYIADRSIKVTSLGLQIADTLQKYVPDLVDEKLTRKFEKELDKIMQNKVKKEKILSQAKKLVIKISEEFREHEDKIGKDLGKAVVETQNDKAILGPCPVCKVGTLKVMFSPFTKKNFVGCSSYTRCKSCGFTKKACKCKCPICDGEKGKCKCVWKEKIWNPSCTYGMPLPHGATFQRTDKICEKCNTPIIMVYRKGKRPFKMCIDIKCPTKADWAKPGEKKKKFVKKKK